MLRVTLSEVVTMLRVALSTAAIVHFAAAAAAAAGAGGDRSAPGGNRMTVDAEYPGGNIRVVGIEGDVARLAVDLRDTAGWWFYFNFRVRGAAGRKVRFEFTDGNPIGVRGPAVSRDRGESWSWLGRGAVEGRGFAYDFPADADDVRFAFCIPYLEADLRRFLERHADALSADRQAPALSVETLCKTPKGRRVEFLRVRGAGEAKGPARRRVLVTARHHACESMADYVMEGLVEAALGDDPLGEWFRSEVELVCVPFVDKDGVERGDQGKNRRPRDHGRDYEGEPVHAETRAVRERLIDPGEARPSTVLDLHCPWIRGAHNEDVYFVGSEDPAHWERVEDLCRALERVRRGPIPYSMKSNVLFGQAWNTSANYRGGRSISRYARSLPGVRFAAAVEIPYATAGGAEVNPGSSRALGRDLAAALRELLAEASPGPEE